MKLNISFAHNIPIHCINEFDQCKLHTNKNNITIEDVIKGYQRCSAKYRECKKQHKKGQKR